MEMLSFRPMSADWVSIMQVFGQDQFACLANIPRVEVIVDLGAYSGYSAYYLKYLYPDSKLIAVEPQEIPFLLCKRNLAGLSNVHIINAAIWPVYAKRLHLVRTYGRSKRFFHETATRVVLGAGRFLTPCITMPQLFKRFNLTKIDLLKVDIEGVECKLFQRAFALWISKVRNIAIEFHSREARDILLNTLAGYHYTMFDAGELSIFKDIRRKV